MSALEALSVDDSRARLIALRTADKIQDVLELFGRETYKGHALPNPFSNILTFQYLVKQ